MKRDRPGLTLAAIGCGGRTKTYMELAVRQNLGCLPVAAADLNPDRVAWVKALSNNPEFRTFSSAEEILAQPKLADVMIIGTQDRQHRDHAVAAMEKGYDLLLEKPIATNLQDTLAVQQTAQRLGKKVLVCHVLRYTELYRTVKREIENGTLGEVVSLNAQEGVGAWHFAHSYVRGHWAVTADSSPMILAKSCHDLDLLRWLADAPCESVSSFGRLTHFTTAQAPSGAPDRCHLGCPVAETCLYNSKRYLGDERKWLQYICDLEGNGSEPDIRTWLETSPWGRCVYRCDNDAVDHQTVQLNFRSGVTATFTMTAFAEGRRLDIYGTRGVLRAGEACGPDGEPIGIWFHDGRKPVGRHPGTAGEGYDGHAGGDEGLMRALVDEMGNDRPDTMTSSLQVSVASHRLAFAADQSRRTGKTVHLRPSV